MRKIQFAKGHIYHIYNRGVEKRDIFLSDNDRWRFLQGLFLFNDEKTVANLLFRLEKEKKALNFKILREYLNQWKDERKALTKIMLDCLKPNHFHLLLEEISDGGISRFMQKLGVGYTRYFNKKYERNGHLFQGPFQVVRVENDDQLRYLIAYINVINPLQEIESQTKEGRVKDVDRIMKFLENYPWSTHLEYLGKRDSVIIDKGMAGKMFSDTREYKEFIQEIILGKKNLNSIKDLMLE
ncbi:transposase [Patescibacteria group bacterium]|nr:transposase [Patescibacteria group bacterium]